MSALVTTSTVLDEALRSAGLTEAFDDRGIAYEDCPGCGATKGLKLSLGRGQAQCGACGSAGPLIAYLREKAEAGEWNHEPFSGAEIIPMDSKPVSGETRATDIVPVRDEPMPESVPLQAELIEDMAPERPAVAASSPARPRSSRRASETAIISFLAIVFLCAGLAAAALSGFANYQAFSTGVTDMTQARIWGWSGVIASVCSFGGFTFFWWHVSGGRTGEAARSLAFAFAGAGTSIAGTSLYMSNNAQEQVRVWEDAKQVQWVTEAEIADWQRQLHGIPPETRSVAGLEAYLKGVELAGRTHQKPYRDAQNELGLAQRRADLEEKIASARQSLREAAASGETALPAKSLPAWFFALMLELFSSQATSIAFVSLLLLFGRVSPQSVMEDEPPQLAV